MASDGLRSQLGSRRLAAVGLAASAALAAIGVSLVAARLHVPPTAGTLQQIDLSGLDPAVAETISASRQAVLAAPASAAAWGHLALQLLGHRLPDADILPVLAEAERIDRTDPRWPFHQGVLLERLDPERAAQKYRRAAALTSDPSSVPRLRLAECLLAQDELDAAETELRRILIAAPNHWRAELDLARLYLRRHDLQPATAHAERAESDPHTRKAALELLAQVRARADDLVGARRAAELAGQQPDDLPWPDPFGQEPVELRTGLRVALARADQLISRGSWQEAADHLDRVLAKNTGSEAGWLLLGRAKIGLKRLDDAERALRTAVELSPRSADARFNLGVVLYLKRQVAAAAAEFDQATQLEPTFAVAWYNLADCRRELGNRTAAIEALRVAVRCKPGYAIAHEALGELLAGDGHTAQAIEHLKQAVQLDETRQRAWALLTELRAAGQQTFEP